MKNRLITCEEIVQSYILASNPAYKAHATRKLNSYVKQQCELTGSKPSRIIAGVRAALTKRKKKNAGI